MITALLLAAGQGSRMQFQAKALLPLGSSTFVHHALHQLHEAGIEDIVLVTGSQRDVVWQAAHASAVPVREAYNDRYQSGILSSIQAGLRQCHERSSAVLITLVDLPLLVAADYRDVCDAWRNGDPTHCLRSQSLGKPAHPVVIPRHDFQEILEQPPGDKGCSFLFQRYPERVRYHEITRGRIDIDTIEDYHAHISS